MATEKRRRGYISDVTVQNGSVLCTIEDADIPNREYSQIPMLTSSMGTISVPAVGAEVVIGFVRGEPMVEGVVSSPPETGSSNDMEGAAQDTKESMSLVFGNLEGGSAPNHITVEETASGYSVSIDVDGDVSISAGGNVTIDEGGTAKKLLTEDAIFEYDDTGDTSDGSASATTKTTTTVSNSETTETEIE